MHFRRVKQSFEREGGRSDSQKQFFSNRKNKKTISMLAHVPKESIAGVMGEGGRETGGMEQKDDSNSKSVVIVPSRRAETANV